jgi:hypothetical protein
MFNILLCLPSILCPFLPSISFLGFHQSFFSPIPYNRYGAQSIYWLGFGL